MSSRGWICTRVFKIGATQLLYNSDKPVEEITESPGVSQSSLPRWRQEYHQDPDHAFPDQVS